MTDRKPSLVKVMNSDGSQSFLLRVDSWDSLAKQGKIYSLIFISSFLFPSTNENLKKITKYDKI